MHRVLEHIDRELDQRLDLDALARVANFSPFHFHRLFTAWFGETLGEYVRRRRLEVAAQRLIAQPRLPILQVALSVGFASTEAFARAFKTRFAATPTAWRDAQVSNRDQLKSKADQARPPASANHGAAGLAPALRALRGGRDVRRGRPAHSSVRSAPRQRPSEDRPRIARD